MASPAWRKSWGPAFWICPSKFHLTVTPDSERFLWIKALNFYTSSHKTEIQNFQCLTTLLKGFIHWHWLKIAWKNLNERERSANVAVFAEELGKGFLLSRLVKLDYIICIACLGHLLNSWIKTRSTFPPIFPLSQWTTWADTLSFHKDSR